MLTPQHTHRGVTLIELSVGLAIVAIIMVSGVPSFGKWLQSSQIRTAAEAIQNGLQKTRAEAVQRNTRVKFELTALADGGTGVDWKISCVTPIADGVADCPGTGVVPTEIQSRSATEGTRNAVVAVAPAQTEFVFNGMGRLVPAAGIAIDITNPTGGACATLTDKTPPMRCMRVVVSTGGQVRMCDPARATPDPQAC
ncbi:GspH/FimT family pseudopilin [Propionivibrio sp.]|uniref:GspH/FimT family pseudopilin n=1 Tax=Propionivibrio sp. TaxID=2212460 RepID=UPI003BF2F773